MKGMIKVGRWANEHKRAAAAILDKQTFYLDVEDTYQGIKHIDMVPNLSPQNMASIEIGKDFMLSHGYIKNDFDVHEWARAGVLREGGGGSAEGRVGEAELGASCPRRRAGSVDACGSGSPEQRHPAAGSLRFDPAADLVVSQRGPRSFPRSQPSASWLASTWTHVVESGQSVLCGHVTIW